MAFDFAVDLKKKYTQQKIRKEYIGVIYSQKCKDSIIEGRCESLDFALACHRSCHLHGRRRCIIDDVCRSLSPDSRLSMRAKKKRILVRSSMTVAMLCDVQYVNCRYNLEDGDGRNFLRGVHYRVKCFRSPESHHLAPPPHKQVCILTALFER